MLGGSELEIYVSDLVCRTVKEKYPFVWVALKLCGMHVDIKFARDAYYTLQHNGFHSHDFENSLLSKNAKRSHGEISHYNSNGCSP